MNKVKILKIFMIISGIVAGVTLISLMILNHYLWDLDLLSIIGICFATITLWIITNIIGIKIILNKYKNYFFGDYL